MENDKMTFSGRMSGTGFAVVTAVLCLLAGSSVWWLSSPLQWKVNGYSIPLLGDPLSPEGFTKTFRALSFGSVCFFLALLTVFFSVVKPLRKMLLLPGIGGVALAGYFFLKLFLLDPRSINTLIYQQGQYNAIILFSKQFLKDTNMLQVPSYEGEYGFIISRITYGFTFISGGFYATLLGGTILVAASRKFFVKRYRVALLGTSVVALVLAVFVCRNVIVSEYTLMKADQRSYAGFTDEAIALYQKAERLNPDLAASENYYYKLGLAEYLHRDNSPSVHFFKARNAQRQKLFPESLAEYEAASRDKTLRQVVPRLMAGLFNDKGTEAYRTETASSAAYKFIGSSLIDPWQSASHFFLSKAFLDIYRFDQHPGIHESSTLLALSSDKVLRADVYNMLGDEYYKTLQFDDARDMYDLSRKSFKLTSRIINFNAMKGLQGM